MSRKKAILFLSVFLLALYALRFAPCCCAYTPEDEYRKVQKDIKKQKRKLENMKKRESSVLVEIERTNRQLEAVEKDLRKYKNILMNTEARIYQVEKEISLHRSEVEKHRDWLRKKIRAIHKYGQHSDVMLLFLGTDDISLLMRTGKYLEYMTMHEQSLLIAYKNTLEGLTEKETQLRALRRDLIKNRAKVSSEEQSLEEKKRSKEDLLTSIKREKSSSARLLKEMKAASKRLLEIIRESEKAEKEDSLARKNFASLKGRLPWPVNGRVAIPYGSQRDPHFNTPIFRSGTYIKSAADSFAKAVHSGKVVFAEWFKGYGQLVIVNHGGGYHTLYGSLAEIFTKVGDIIEAKQAVGRVGDSGILNSPGLYFELRYKGKPLNPQQWLKRK
jgi:septal ring factor EnvC (AmiA/AmiB activator)